MLTIELSKLLFHANHGLYKEENLLGGTFEVNVTIVHLPKQYPVLHLDETIDYAAVYKIIKEQMLNPKPLLETVASTIADEIFKHFPSVIEVTVSVTKIKPPMIGFEGSVGVKCSLKRNA